MAQAFSFALCALRLALCKLVRCSEAIERNEAYESFSAACQEKIMVWNFRIDVKFWLFSLLVFVFDPLNCGMSRTDLLAAEIPAPITITEGKTAQ